MNNMKFLKTLVLSSFLVAVSACSSEDLEHQEPIHFSKVETFYSGDLEKLLEMDDEAMRAELARDFLAISDPTLELEVDEAAFLEHFDGYVMAEDANQLRQRLYTMNDLGGEETFLPESPVLDLEWDGLNRCDRWVPFYLREWPGAFVASTDPFFKGELPFASLEISPFTLSSEGEHRLQLTCHEYSESEGGIYDGLYELTLYYDEELGKLREMLVSNPHAEELKDGILFQVTQFQYDEEGELLGRIEWGAWLESNQLAIPRIQYHYLNEVPFRFP